MLGLVADWAGRKPTAITSLSLMALRMFGAAHASGIGPLAALRLVTGIGIGGFLHIRRFFLAYAFPT